MRFDAHDRTIATTRKTPMAHNDVAFAVRRSSGDASESAGPPRLVFPTPRADEPYLFDIPPNLSATYRPIPWWIHCLVGTLSLAAAGRNVLSDWILRRPSPQLVWTVRRALLFLLRYAAIWSSTTLVLQEGMYPPSRVTARQLSDAGNLPSAFSRYETVTPSNDDTTDSPPVPIGVHSLRYKNASSDDTKPSFGAIQLHHGFGASSLSWLPVLPSLVDRLRARVGIAHDAPGFGFTDRPDADTAGGLRQYGVANSVGIGLALLRDAVDGDENDDDAANDVAIFGHSMGTKAALLTALACSSEGAALRMRPKLVVLVAPALEGLTLPPRSRKMTKAEIPEEVSGVRRWLASFWIVGRKLFVDYPFQYVLRRLVGTKNFWRRGLSLAWGDPRRLSDSDVLRFQWPSIGKGWERGLLSFARGITSSDDANLLREVVRLPQTTVLIVYGSKDNIVRVDERVFDVLKSDFPMVKVLRMEGLGHDPFEEDKEMFLSELEKVLQMSTS